MTTSRDLHRELAYYYQSFGRGNPVPANLHTEALWAAIEEKERGEKRNG